MLVLLMAAIVVYDWNDKCGHNIVYGRQLQEQDACLAKQVMSRAHISHSSLGRQWRPWGGQWLTESFGNALSEKIIH